MIQTSRNSEHPSICFVAPQAHGALPGQNDRDVNGAEFQQAIIARALVDRGYPVSFITEDYGESDGANLSGIRVFNAYRKRTGLRFVRFVHPRLTGLWKAMNRSGADIFFQRASDVTTGIVAAFCRKHRRKFVFSTASDVNCYPDLPYCLRHEKIFYRYGLRRADRVIAQTNIQQRLFRENFGIEAVVIPNCGPDWGAEGSAEMRPKVPPKRLLWIGRWIKSKRLEMLLEIAERKSNIEFDIIGDIKTGCDPSYKHDLQRRARLLSNVHVHGRVRRTEIRRFYMNAGALICTSLFEGFPNTFVEAWSCGLPVISTFDPGEAVQKYSLGVIAQDIPGLIAGAKNLLASPAEWHRISRRSREHYLKHHTVDLVVSRIEEVFCDLMGQEHLNRELL